MPTVTAPATFADLALRLVFATVAGALIGLNREIVGKPAGLRTHALVALGAAAATVMALGLAGDPAAPSRVVQGILAGVGFIGGGVILHDRLGVHGLTTAASIWVVAAAGVTAAGGLWRVTALIIVLGLVVLILGEFADRALRRRFHRHDRDGASS